MDISDVSESLVVGNVMERSLQDFIQGCCVHLQIEQRQPTPDSALISLLRDAVRLAREMVTRIQRIHELEEAKDLLERGSYETVLELARARGTITALSEHCRIYARGSD